MTVPHFLSGVYKPANEMNWSELAKLLKDAHYRVFWLANLAVSEAYLRFHLWRTKKADEFERETIGNLNQRLRERLKEEDTQVFVLNQFQSRAERIGIGSVHAPREQTEQRNDKKPPRINR